MSVNQTLLDFRVTPDAPDESWMEPVQDKVSEIIKESFQAEQDFRSSTVILFTGQHGM